MKIIAVVPAHNEAGQIENTVTTLLKQNVKKVIVVCDNCTDMTKHLATKAGATIFETINNKHRKAGALNQALNKYIDKINSDDALLICDADTVINPRWIERAEHLISKVQIDAVGSIFKASDTSSFLKYCQMLEWERYSHEVQIKKKVFVLTGTASLIKVSAFQKVHKHFGHFYNKNSITEDFTLTLDLKEVGSNLISPASCSAITETMPNIKSLYLQRRRWYLGALQQMKSRKWTSTLVPYLWQQIMLSISVFSFMLLLIFSLFLIFSNSIEFNVFWIFIGLIFATERIITVWSNGWKARLFAACVFPELLYSFFLQVAFLGAWIQLLSGSRGTWNHI